MGNTSTSPSGVGAPDGDAHEGRKWAPHPPPTDWEQDEDWWAKLIYGDEQLGFYEEWIEDWPPYVAARQEIARLRTAIETHRQRTTSFVDAHPIPMVLELVDQDLYAALNPEDTP